VSGINMVPVYTQVVKNVVDTKKKIKNVEINKLQKILRHRGKTHLKATAHTYGIKIFGN
jgi:hypothetical protein